MLTTNSLRVTFVCIASFFVVLSTSIAFAQKCYNYGNERLFCSEPNSNCDTAENSLVKWCETKLFAKVKETVENNYFLRKRALSFDLVECLRATTEADCVAKSCFWFSGKDCIPKELVP